MKILTFDARNQPVIKAKGTKKLFENDILEKLTRTHIAIPVSLFVLYSCCLLYWSITHTSLVVWIAIFMFLLGFILFTWVEYNVHRYVFHMLPSSSKKKEIQYLIHGVHHEFPKDKDRLAMPPIVSISIATLLLFLFRMNMGDLVFSFLPGFLTGYAVYLFMHYIVHAYRSPKNFFRFLWINHAIHHYRDGNIFFGVSSPLWDYIYGTTRIRNVSNE